MNRRGRRERREEKERQKVGCLYVVRYEGILEFLFGFAGVAVGWRC